MHGEDIVKEIQLKEDECCIVFDLGCYFPYLNAEILTFDFQLGEETIGDYKLNHRYSNRGYQTISKKNGRRVSKLGYPYVLKLNEQIVMLMCVKIGIKDKYITLIFPVETNMTKDKPICFLSLHYIFDENRFNLSTFEPTDNCGLRHHYWLSKQSDNITEYDTVLSPPSIIEKSKTLIYHDVITPYASCLKQIF